MHAVKLTGVDEGVGEPVAAHDPHVAARGRGARRLNRRDRIGDYLG